MPGIINAKTNIIDKKMPAIINLFVVSMVLFIKRIILNYITLKTNVNSLGSASKPA
jgi:type III secretory pathway component EscS